MKKVLFISFSIFLTHLGYSQNTLLTNPSTTAIPSSVVFDDIEIVTKDGHSVLFCTNSDNNVIYAIDIDGNSSTEAADNLVTDIPNFANLLDDATGQSSTELVTYEVHPISKRIYALVENASGSGTYIVEIKENGDNVSVLDLNAASYAKLNWPVGFNYAHEDMAWGADKLIVTSGDWSLESQIAILEPPFEHESTIDYRLSSMFKTNWGGGYKSRAPLERIEYAYINNEDRLLGVTVCAPGFSLPYADIPGSGTLQVKEQFNVNFDPPKKVVHQEQDNGHFLFDLHEVFGGNKLIRIGEAFLDGSPLVAGEVNADVKFIKDNFGSITNGLTDAEGKIYSNTFEDIAFWDNCHLLVLEQDHLKLFETGQSTACTPLSTEEIDNDTQFSLSPNPAQSILVLRFNKDLDYSRFVITSMEGRTVLQNSIVQLETTIDISELTKGTYLFEVQSNSKTSSVQKLVIQ